MALQEQRRRIIFNGKELADLNPAASVEEVIKMHALQTPSLATAIVEAPVTEGDTLTYTVKNRIGTKG